MQHPSMPLLGLCAPPNNSHGPPPRPQMLQEELRRCRQRVGEQEGLLAARDRTLAALRDELARERQRLQACATAPDDLLQERQFRQMLAER